MSKIVEHLIYETEEEHDARIRREDARFHFKKKRSRSQARNVGVRRQCFRRADFKCEICRFAFEPVLVLHHITPVRFGGPAAPSNLIALCPNCHGLVHNYNHYASTLYEDRRYPGWIGALTKRAGLTEDQAKRLIMVASKDARIMDDGSLVKYKEPSPLVSIIVDEQGNQVYPEHNPAKVAAALDRIEKMFGGDDFPTIRIPSALGEASR